VAVAVAVSAVAAIAASVATNPIGLTN